MEGSPSIFLKYLTPINVVFAVGSKDFCESFKVNAKSVIFVFLDRAEFFQKVDLLLVLKNFWKCKR